MTEADGLEARLRPAVAEGDGDAAVRLRELLVRRGGLDGGCSGTAPRGRARFKLLAHYGDWAAAEAAHRRAHERGSGIGAYNLALALRSRGDHEGARAAAKRARERGTPGDPNIRF